MDPVFDIDKSGVDGHARVRFVGELDMAEMERAHDEVVEVLDQTAGVLTIDLSGLTFCDSSGVEVLFRLDSEAKARGRTMVVQHPTPAVSQVFRLLRVAEVLTVEDLS
jgi:anti-sigma B factor antagonist